jgi:hypothetical protein
MTALMSSKHFLTQKEIHLWLRTIPTLDSRQRDCVEREMMKFMGSGGISRDELDYQLLKKLRELRDHGAIGSADYSAIEAALKKLYGEI